MGGRYDEGSVSEASVEESESNLLLEPSLRRSAASHGFAERRNLGAPSRPRSSTNEAGAAKRRHNDKKSLAILGPRKKGT